MWFITLKLVAWAHGQKGKNILKTTQEKPNDWSYTQKLTMVVDDPNF
jgi:hypothetical protein